MSEKKIQNSENKSKGIFILIEGPAHTGKVEIAELLSEIMPGDEWDYINMPYDENYKTSLRMLKRNPAHYLNVELLDLFGANDKIVWLINHGQNVVAHTWLQSLAAVKSHVGGEFASRFYNLQESILIKPDFKFRVKNKFDNCKKSFKRNNYFDKHNIQLQTHAFYEHYTEPEWIVLDRTEGLEKCLKTILEAIGIKNVEEIITKNKTQITAKELDGKSKRVFNEKIDEKVKKPRTGKKTKKAKTKSKKTKSKPKKEKVIEIDPSLATTDSDF